MKRLPAGIISTLLSLTMTLTPCSMSALAAQENSRDFSLFFSGPGVAALSSGDEYSEYQWALNNTGRLRRTEKVLNIKTLDHIYLHYGENGIDDIALPPLGPDNFESINTDAVANIDINIEDAWKTYSETENKRTVTVAIIDTGIDTDHSDLKDSIWVNEDEIPGDGIDNDGNGYVDDVNGWNFVSNSNEICTGEEDSHDRLTSKEAIKMATINGAKLLKLDDKVGSIEEGKDADIILVDMSQNLDNITKLPNNDIISNLVYNTCGRDVCTTIIKGNILMEDRKLKNMDIDEVIEKVHKILK